MSDRAWLSTSITLEDDTEVDVRVLYQRYKGYRGNYYQPSEPASVEIIKIVCADPEIGIPDHFGDNEELKAECMADWEVDAEDAAEWRAQCRRDALLMGGEHVG